MNIQKVIIHNFLSYKHSEIEFPIKGIYNFIGHNGAGKSAIREAISWGLFGKTCRVDLIHNGESDMYVLVDFMVNNKNYIVTRSIVKGESTKLEVIEN
jgi:exonuclease SbcC